MLNHDGNDALSTLRLLLFLLLLLLLLLYMDRDALALIGSLDVDWNCAGSLLQRLALLYSRWLWLLLVLCCRK